MKYRFKYYAAAQGYTSVDMNDRRIAIIKNGNMPDVAPVENGTPVWEKSIQLSEAKDHHDIDGLNLGMSRAVAEWLLPTNGGERI